MVCMNVPGMSMTIKKTNHTASKTIESHCCFILDNDNLLKENTLNQSISLQNKLAGKR